MIASCVMFYVNGLIGIAVVALLAKLPRELCCYSNYTIHKGTAQDIQSKNYVDCTSNNAK